MGGIAVAVVFRDTQWPKVFARPTQHSQTCKENTTKLVSPGVKGREIVLGGTPACCVAAANKGDPTKHASRARLRLLPAQYSRVHYNLVPAEASGPLATLPSPSLTIAKSWTAWRSADPSSVASQSFAGFDANRAEGNAIRTGFARARARPWRWGAIAIGTGPGQAGVQQTERSAEKGREKEREGFNSKSTSATLQGWGVSTNSTKM